MERRIKMTVKECNKIRAEIFKVYKKMKYGKKSAFKKYSLEEYFKDLDAKIIEICYESLKEKKEILRKKNDD